MHNESDSRIYLLYTGFAHTNSYLQSFENNIKAETSAEVNILIFNRFVAPLKLAVWVFILRWGYSNVLPVQEVLDRLKHFDLVSLEKRMVGVEMILFHKLFYGFVILTSLKWLHCTECFQFTRKRFKTQHWSIEPQYSSLFLLY